MLSTDDVVLLASLRLAHDGRGNDLKGDQMLSLLWNISASIRGYLRFYMPTNRALDWLRSPRGLRWAIPMAMVATPAYLFGMSACAVIAQRPGLSWINVLVVLLFWNALKFAWLALLAPLTGLRLMLTRKARAAS